MEAPRPQPFRLEQVEDEPGQLLVLDERDEPFAPDGVEAVNAQAMQLFQGVAEAVVGPMAGLAGLLDADQSGTIGIGGTAVTRVSLLFSVPRITGTRVTGSLPGVTIPTRITPGMAPSTLTTICRPTR